MSVTVVSPRPRRCGLLLAFALVPAHLAAQASDPWTTLRAESFVRPAANIERLVTTPRTDISFANLSPNRSLAMRLTGPGRGSIAAYGKPHLWLGGLQVDTAANRARSLSTARWTGIDLVSPRTGSTQKVEAPAGAVISDPAWSPDGGRIAFLAHFASATYIYVADAATGRSTRVGRTPLLATLVTAPQWTPDGRSLLAVIAPANRGAVPTLGNNGVASGPQVRLTEGVARPQRVHFSLLEDPHQVALYKYYTRGQLVLIDARSGAQRNIGQPAMIRSVDASPDARYFRVTSTVEPFSYIVPHTQFGSVTELWDAQGRVVATLATRPLRQGEEQPTARNRGETPDTTRRNWAWHPRGGLTYLVTTVGSNGRATGTRWMHWKAPFGPADTARILDGSARLTTVLWGSDTATVFVSDSGATFAIRVSEPSARFNLGRGVSLPSAGGFGGGDDDAPGAVRADTIGVGGTLEARRNVDGAQVIQMSRDGSAVFATGVRRYGNDWYRRAPRPWLDRIAISNAARTRLLDSPAETYEEFVAALDADFSEVIVTRQSPTVIEDSWYRNISAGTERKLTNAVDVGPELTGAVRKRIQITRPRDGIKFWADVTLPRGWQPGQRMPGIIWHYPREYATAEAYERSRWSVNINQFPAVPQSRPASAIVLWVAAGYALVNPDIPIFGDSGKMNDNYTRDLADNLDAVLNAVVDSGFVDRERMGIGGHSYGAFGTVNAMTLLPHFKAGIAGDGMYNRTLTPFGFQSERRDFYEAQDTYLDMSPFLRADRLAGALLMYHATEDQNAGTHPMSSIRMQQALQGLGKTSALFMYPYEDHSVATFESDLDLWARWVAWFDLYVKRPGPVLQ